jgi:CRP/FNR family transcriptional regulator, cyclic AMP receptor protein
LPDPNTHEGKAALAAMAGASAFKNAPEEARQALFKSGHLLSLKSGELLFQHGEPGGSMFVVVSGLIEVSVLTLEGRKVSLNRLGNSECFGEISMIDGRSRTADGVALIDTRLLSITHDAFFDAAKRYPELGFAMVQLLCERVRWLSDSVEDYAILPLERRLARRLQVLFDRFGGEKRSIEIAQIDLADFVGATRESVNKILIGWRRRGLISMGRKTILLIKKDGLSEIAFPTGS